jgi:hypothetical protein
MPRRFLLMGVLVLASLGAWRLCLDAQLSTQVRRKFDDTAMHAAMNPRERERRAVLDDLAVRQAAFSRFAERVLAALRAGDIDLEDATDRVYFYALHNYPELLASLADARPSLNVKAAIARNLMDMLEARRTPN